MSKIFGEFYNNFCFDFDIFLSFDLINYLISLMLILFTL